MSCMNVMLINLKSLVSIKCGCSRHIGPSAHKGKARPRRACVMMIGFFVVVFFKFCTICYALQTFPRDF